MESKKSLKELGYSFNADGCLRQLDENGKLTDKPFQFKISDDHTKCQHHYEEIGEAITDHVYNLLDKMDFIRLPVPEDSDSTTGTFVFATKNYMSASKLFILIHGSGVVRAGQWARSLIINDSLEKGTQIPYIKRAIEKGFAVLIMNTNDNSRIIDKKVVPIKKSETPEAHAAYVWEKYIKPSKATKIAIVAHSYGGEVTVQLAVKKFQEFRGRVLAVGFTDSVHSCDTPRWFVDISRNWIASSKPVNTPHTTPPNEISRVSAGHPRHEMTSYSALDAIFEFITDKIPKSIAA